MPFAVDFGFHSDGRPPAPKQFGAPARDWRRKRPEVNSHSLQEPVDAFRRSAARRLRCQKLTKLLVSPIFATLLPGAQQPPSSGPGRTILVIHAI